MLVKIFLGFALSPKFSHQLSCLSQWKEERALSLANEGGKIEEVHFQGKSYLGVYCASSILSMEELENKKLQIKAVLKETKLELPFSFSWVLFSQGFFL